MPDDAQRVFQRGWASEAGARLRSAFADLRRSTAEARTAGLSAMAGALRANADTILAANREDLSDAAADSKPAAFIDRLALDAERLDAIITAVETVAALPDPAGSRVLSWTAPSGVRIDQVREPLGAIGVIFESRPNVAADAAALCLRAGDVCVLRGGRDCERSVSAIVAALREGLAAAGLPADAVQTPPGSDRAYVGDILGGLDGALDLVIPRGGKDLVARVQRDARVPVLGHLDGVCHVYVHADAEPDMARDIVLNSKMRRTGVCNAAETLLIDSACAQALLPDIAWALIKAGCTLRGDARAQTIAPEIEAASAADWDAEYLDAILTVGVVDGLDGALAHIARHGSGHTDAIVTTSEAIASRFLSEVDSAVVLHNASTGFSDGGEFGFGAEIGIATGRIHARGPVGAEQLTTTKYQVRGGGQVRS
ncbi:MAG: glutamate-5-semialdehyde dehydrogenase [Pseudomonadota bacterium]